MASVGLLEGGKSDLAEDTSQQDTRKQVNFRGMVMVGGG